MRIERFQIRSTSTGRVFDSGERPLGRLVLIHGGGEPGEAIASEFLGSLMLGVVEAATGQPNRAAPPRSPHVANPRPTRAGRIELRTTSGEALEVSRSESGAVVTPNGRTPTITDPHAFRLIFAPHDEAQAPWTLDNWDRFGRQATTGVEEAARAELAQRQLVTAQAIGPIPLANTRQCLQELEARRAHTRLQRSATHEGLGRLAKLWPLHYQLRLIDQWRRDAGPLDELFGLPVDPAAKLTELERRAGELELEVSRLQAAREQAQAASRSLRDVDRRLLDRAVEVDNALRTAVTVRNFERDDRALAAEQARLVRALAAVERATFTSRVDRGWLRSVNLDLLGRELTERTAAREAVAGLERERVRLRHAQPDEPPAFPFVAVVLYACGAGGAGLALDNGNPALTAGSAGLLVIALLITAGWKGRGRASQEQLDAHNARMDALSEDLARARNAAEGRFQAVERTMAGAKARRELSDHYPTLLLSRLQEGRATLAELRRVTQSRSRLERRIAAGRDLLAHVWSAVFVHLAPATSLEERVWTLRDGMSEAMRRSGIATQAIAEEERLRELSQPIELRVVHVRHSLKVLSGRLSAIGAGNAALGCREVSARWQSLNAAQWLESKVRAASADPCDAEVELRELARGFETMVDADDLVIGLNDLSCQLDSQLMELEESIRRTRAELELQQAAAVGDSEGHSDQVTRELERQLVALEQQRNDLDAIDHLIGEADRNFLENEQPAIVERANDHLDRIRGASNDAAPAILAEDGTRFRIRRTAVATEANASNTDDGGPAVLALRLALSERFDGETERTPIFLRQSFAAWPEDQRQRTWELLREYSVTRQVFVFAERPDWFGLEADEPRSDRSISIRCEGHVPAPRFTGLREAFARRFGDVAGRVRTLLDRPAPEVPNLPGGHEASRGVATARRIIDRVFGRDRIDVSAAPPVDSHVTPNATPNAETTGDPSHADGSGRQPEAESREEHLA